MNELMDIALPDQPIVLDKQGIARFSSNRIVRCLLEHASRTQRCDLNDLAAQGHMFTQQEWQQFYQLIGYSVSGYGDLSNVSRESIERADRVVETLIPMSKKDDKPRPTTRLDFYWSYEEVNHKLRDLGVDLSNDKNVEDPACIVGRLWNWEGFDEKGPALESIGLEMREHVVVHDKYDLFIYTQNG